MKTALKDNQQVWALADKCVTGDLKSQEAVINYIDYLHSRIRDFDTLLSNVQSNIESREQRPYEQEKLDKIV